MAATIPAPIQGKKALVTGGSRGIGAAIAFELARLGASHIAITYQNNADAASRVISRIKTENSETVVKAIQADLLDENFGVYVVKQACIELNVSNLDIVVSNAAILDERIHESFEIISLKGFQLTMLANAWAPLQVMQAALPVMNRGGRIINISSSSSTRSNPDPIMTYGMSKAAVDNLTKSVAVKYAAEKGITINSVSPGPTETDILAGALKASEDLAKRISQGATAEKRPGKPEDVAEIVGFLAGPGGRWINASLIPADGGRVV